MDFLIITGLSGAGKSRVIDSLEDIGYFCVDNVPPMLIGKFHELCVANNGIDNVAVVTDIRGGDMFASLADEIKKFKAQKKKFRLLYVDCATETLINRYKETRRKHPLADKYNRSINDAVEAERVLLQPARGEADYIIDTTQLSSSELKKKVEEMFSYTGSSSFMVNVVSFGFKYGSHHESDLMFDVRCFPNPYYSEVLRELTGLDEAVRDFVLDNSQVEGFIEKLNDMLDYLIPLYITEGKTRLVVGIGCTGGRHRSVAIAESVGQHLRENVKRVIITHRDKDRR
ncbi:MAG: RNase adapter RapZ [Oscillospiraceae bacterium]|jgi:UPF0042 nucleotide-binding protein|nr:RNase adapter RapZ [Oscillospiraceae bacterium]